MKLQILITSLFIGSIMTGLSENVIHKFDFKGGDIDDLAKNLETSLRSSNLDFKLVKNYDDKALHFFKASWKNMPLKTLVSEINNAVGYEILEAKEEGELVLYGKTGYFHLTATRAFELTDQTYISASGDKGKLEKLLSDSGILFNKKDGATVVRISSDKPYVATIRNNTAELDLIDSLLTLLARVEKVESKPQIQNQKKWLFRKICGWI